MSSKVQSRVAWRRLEGSYSSIVKRDPAKSLVLIARAAEWMAAQLAQTPFRGFPQIWKPHAIYHVASPLILSGCASELRVLLPGEPFWAEVLRLGPVGRRLGNALLLLRLSARAFFQTMRRKLGVTS